MRQYVVAPESLVLGWCVSRDGLAVGSHFTQGLAIADALNRAHHERAAGRRVEVRLQEHSGRNVILLRADLPLTSNDLVGG